MAQCIQEQVRILPAIKPESHFVQVGREMLCRDAMPCSDDAALQERESILDRVCMDVAVNVDLGLVFDRFVLLGQRESFHGRGVCVKFIGHDHVNIGTHVFSNELRQGAGLRILRVEEPQVAATLPDTDYDLLGAFPESRLALMAALYSADIGLIYFDGAVHHGALCFLHCCSDAMAEIPCGFVAHSERALDLVGAHALACFAEEQGSEKPFLQRQMRIVKDRAGRDAELVVAFLAIEQLLGRRQLGHWTFASQALNSVWPAEAHKKFAAFFVGIEQIDNVN